MDRSLLEKRILKIIRYLKNDTLAKLFSKNLKLFSEKELEELLGFLESGDFSIMYELLDKKVTEYKLLLNKINLLKGRVKIEKSRSVEEKERETEEQEVEDLIVF